MRVSLRRLRGAAAGAAVLMALVATQLAPTSGSNAQPLATAAAPNIVYVLVDDADAKALRYMPLTRALIADEGATLKNFLYNQPLCCPSRATMLRGQYSQNTGVSSNEGANGGYGAFYGKGKEASTVGTWFDDAGYNTGYLGKYLNGYADQAGLPKTHVPVGWDRWFGTYSSGTGYFGYQVNDDGVIASYGSNPDDYLVDVLASEAQAFIRASGSTPFLLWVSPKAPHRPGTPAPRHEGLFAGAKYPRGPAFNEADVSDKPPPINSLARLTRTEKRDINAEWRDRLRSLQSVDEMVADLVETLSVEGKLANTYLVFASDNGYHMGEHRQRPDKDTPYEEDIRVPLYIRGPGITAGQTITSLIGNVDLPLTFADAAGITPPAFVDGRSFLPLVQGRDVPWRTSYLLGRGLTYPFAGIRTDDSTYVEYNNGAREFYDLATDPDQLTNTYGSLSPTLRTALHDRVTALRTCSGATCRTIESRPLLPEQPRGLDRLG